MQCAKLKDQKYRHWSTEHSTKDQRFSSICLLSNDGELRCSGTVRSVHFH